MNIIEKYIDNLQENDKLYRRIEKLCNAYLMSANDISMAMSNKIAVKVVKWEFSDANVYYPKDIKMTYICMDTKTMEKTEESRTVRWENILIGEEFKENENDE